MKIYPIIIYFLALNYLVKLYGVFFKHLNLNLKLTSGIFFDYPVEHGSRITRLNVQQYLLVKNIFDLFDKFSSMPTYIDYH